MNRLQRIETMIYALASPTHKPALHGGLLKIINRSGSVHTAGDGCGPVFTIEIRNTRVLQKIYSNPDLMLGETYVNGEWDLIQGDLGQFTSWVVRNYKDDIARMPQKELRQNTVPNSRKHVAHHYDMGNDLYESFLDVGMNYSCAFFDDHRMSLRDAQLNKIYTTINRLDVRPGMNVLDIGCGWGETCRTLAHYAPGVNVTGITLSQKQLDGALSVNAKAGINNPHYVLTDYREHAQSHACRYDRIVSIGMFEHVGHRHYHNYFKAIEKLLKPGGQALVHSIMRPEPGRGTSQWLDRYIFPGGCIPYMPEALDIAASAGLELATPPYIHPGHNYAETLRRWRQNYNFNCQFLNARKYDHKFHRLWNFYLACSEAAFDGLDYYVAQMLFQKPPSHSTGNQ